MELIYHHVPINDLYCIVPGGGGGVCDKVTKQNCPLPTPPTPSPVPASVYQQNRCQLFTYATQQ